MFVSEFVNFKFIELLMQLKILFTTEIYLSHIYVTDTLVISEIY